MIARVVTALAAAAACLVPAPASADEPCWGWRCRAVNAVRAAEGVAPLDQRRELQRVARRWAAEMAASGVLSHNPDLGVEVTRHRLLGENVGIGPDFETVMAAFLASPGHRENLLEPRYTQVGIGWATTPDRVWIVTVFRQP